MTADLAKRVFRELQPAMKYQSCFQQSNLEGWTLHFHDQTIEDFWEVRFGYTAGLSHEEELRSKLANPASWTRRD